MTPLFQHSICYILTAQPLNVTTIDIGFSSRTRAQYLDASHMSAFNI